MARVLLTDGLGGWGLVTFDARQRRAKRAFASQTYLAADRIVVAQIDGAHAPP